MIERAVILSKGSRVRLDLAMPRDPSNLAPVESGTGDQADFVTDTEIREREKVNMLAALRHANWRIWGNDGAAELLGLKPSTLTYRMKVFGIRKDA